MLAKVTEFRSQSEHSLILTDIIGDARALRTAKTGVAVSTKWNSGVECESAGVPRGLAGTVCSVASLRATEDLVTEVIDGKFSG